MLVVSVMVKILFLKVKLRCTHLKNKHVLRALLKLLIRRPVEVLQSVQRMLQSAAMSVDWKYWSVKWRKSVPPPFVRIHLHVYMRVFCIAFIHRK